jgi:uncharacterized membrane protein YfcA
MLTVLGALFIGLSLGLLGSGGSILTVPVLVYLLHHESKAAIAESLAIVGGIALSGAIPYSRSRQIDWRNVVFFGVPGMAGTYGGAWLARFLPGTVQLILFAAVMLFAAWMMFRNSKPATDGTHEPRRSHALWKITLEGLAVGAVTGLVGVGGGFLIVPALVLLGGLSMRVAVGTSLVVIALNSFTGFFKYRAVLADLHIPIDWGTVGWFVAIGVFGILLGHWIGTKVNQWVLRRAFAVFLVLMGGFVLSQEVPKVLRARSTRAGSELRTAGADATDGSRTTSPQPVLKKRM